MIFNIESKYDKIDSGYYTDIYKFSLEQNGSINFTNRAEGKGKTINQFSIDEYNDNLRVAISSNEGSKIVVYNNNMKKVGET